LSLLSSKPKKENNKHYGISARHSKSHSKPQSDIILYQTPVPPQRKQPPGLFGSLGGRYYGIG
jgi:hypothetical protein